MRISSLVRLSMTLSMALALAAGSAAGATNCELGLALTPEGDRQIGAIGVGEAFDVYVLLDVEGVADAVSYRLVVDALNVNVFRLSESYGIDGEGINFETDNGSNVGIGECAVGYGNLIVVAHYTFMLVDDLFFRMGLEPNPDESSETPVISECTGALSPCEAGPDLMYEVLPVQSASFGAVKSLYAN